MTIPVQQALSIAREYLADVMPDYYVGGLLEDSEAWMVVKRSDQPVLTPGSAFILVHKSDGKVEQLAPGEGIDREDRMQPVTLS